MNLQPRHIVLAVALLACGLGSVVLGSYAYYANQGFGFPLDDPWIHLQFARNLVEHGAFSYFKDEMVTSGSTAPLYTLLLAAGFLVTGNEMLLSYALGVAMYLGAVMFFFMILGHAFADHRAMVYGGVLVFALDPRLHWIALSGMETTLFVLLLLAVFHAYVVRRPVLLGISAGLLLWTRPEAVIMFGAIAADVALRSLGKAKTEESRTWMMRAIVILAVFGGAYALFNYLLSGTILPNTYAAKLKYYSGTGRDFPREALAFLTTGPLLILSVFSAIGVVMTGLRLLQGKSSFGFVPFLFVAGMIVAYWIKLPYLYQNGRYLMPVLPFFLLLGISGLEWARQQLRTRFSISEIWGTRLLVALLAFLIFQGGSATWAARQDYQVACRYINDRQVRTAHWIRENLPESAIVATHDVGAIAFYSQRRIVDMVGLVSPDMIARIGDLRLLKEYLLHQRVTHLALLRNWFEVVNVPPLFQTDERTPEIMEVFAFDEQRAHFTTSQVSWLTANGAMALARGDLQQGGPLTERAVKMDPMSSRARHHFGWALLMAGRFDQAEAEFRAAIGLYPDYWPAHYALAQVALRRGQPAEALKRLQTLVAAHPSMHAAFQSMAQIQAQLGDTTGARESLERLRVLEPQNRP